ncbi:ribosome maturation factor RimM [Candidatus Erwinia haradaeae]|uniref:Ribosome maturation factor RimM n=1 Tax=Candidatus Erwinia haradaeae TaxID=1922217 RepID=A0A451D941_9GAMM|nr:ribosome maturation factor RimM [Candidatus Erwinia haradaeae]VFP82763.1 Ribosome maturation factor RimM [Candidatus Erwinia haradaeae]
MNTVLSELQQHPIHALIIGTIGSPHGTYGWLKVFSSTEVQTNIFTYQPWFIHKAGKWSIVEIERWTLHHHQIIVKIKGINHPEIAKEQLTNQKIIIHNNQLPLLLEGEYYWKDLIGCQVINTQDTVLGVVIQIIETGSNDVLIVHTNFTVRDKIKERLIPFLHQKVIKNINLKTRMIYVDWD